MPSGFYGHGSYPFPISRDPPEGGTHPEARVGQIINWQQFAISRDPPEGGTFLDSPERGVENKGLQFLGIPPKGELYTY